MKKTPWFPPEVKPEHVGIYETQHSPKATVFRDWWDGKDWCWNCDSRRLFSYQQLYWRGLATKPKDRA